MMFVRLTVYPPKEGKSMWAWTVEVERVSVANGNAASYRMACRRCSQALVAYAEDMEWEDKPPMDIDLNLNFFPTPK